MVSNIQVRRILEYAPYTGTSSKRLVIRNPSTVSFGWFEGKKGGEELARGLKAAELWMKYNQGLIRRLRTFRGFRPENLTAALLGQALEMEPEELDELADEVAEHYCVERPSMDSGTTWKPFAAYVFAHSMPLIEGWKSVYSAAKSYQGEISRSRIEKMCREQRVESRLVLGRWYISPIGEKGIYFAPLEDEIDIFMAAMEERQVPQREDVAGLLSYLEEALKTSPLVAIERLRQRPVARAQMSLGHEFRAIQLWFENYMQGELQYARYITGFLARLESNIKEA